MNWIPAVMEAVGRFQFAPKLGARKLVLQRIASYADWDGRGAAPAVTTTVAQYAGVQERAALEHVRALRAGGYIKPTGLNPIEGGRYTVIYAVALTEATRLLWQAEAEGSFDTWSEEMLPAHTDRGVSEINSEPPVRVCIRPNYQTQTTELLRSSVRACGAEEGTAMAGAPGFERDDEKPSWKPPADDGAHLGRTGYVATSETDPGRQKGAQRRGAHTAGGRLASHWSFRRAEVDWKIPHSRQNCVTDFARHLRDTGVSEEIFMQMIDAWWADPGFRQGLDPARSAHAAFLYRDWKNVLARVERQHNPVTDADYRGGDELTTEWNLEDYARD